MEGVRVRYLQSSSTGQQRHGLKSRREFTCDGEWSGRRMPSLGVLLNTYYYYYYYYYYCHHHHHDDDD